VFDMSPKKCRNALISVGVAMLCSPSAVSGRCEIILSLHGDRTAEGEERTARSLLEQAQALLMSSAAEKSCRGAGS
jgi:hypothetical protein